MDGVVERELNFSSDSGSELPEEGTLGGKEFDRWSESCRVIAVRREMVEGRRVGEEGEWSSTESGERLSDDESV